jgi:hypothetical protein
MIQDWVDCFVGGSAPFGSITCSDHIVPGTFGWSNLGRRHVLRVYSSVSAGFSAENFDWLGMQGQFWLSFGFRKWHRTLNAVFEWIFATDETTANLVTLCGVGATLHVKDVGTHMHTTWDFVNHILEHKSNYTTSRNATAVAKYILFYF